MKTEIVTDNLEVERDLPFRELTTFNIGGPARLLFNCESERGLIEAVQAAKKAEVPFFILGNGSNLLVSDNGYHGLVVKMSNEHCEKEGDEIKAGAGMELSDLVDFALEHELKDLEWAAGIPGTLGGAIRGNAGAFGLDMKEIVKQVKAYDGEREQVVELSNSQCQFGYRQSIFKQNPNLIVLEATLVLNSGDQDKIKSKIEQHLNYRKENHPLEYPCSGSVFQNPKTKIEDEELLKRYPKLEEFNEQELIPAGWLTEQVGLAGEKVGPAQISEKHSNFIVNLGGAEAKDVMKLIKEAQEKVEQEFGVELELEIETLGF